MNKQINFMTFRELKESKNLPWAYPTTFAMMEYRNFPKPVIFSKRKRFWIEEEVDEWLRQHITDRDQTTI